MPYEYLYAAAAVAAAFVLFRTVADDSEERRQAIYKQITSNMSVQGFSTLAGLLDDTKWPTKGSQAPPAVGSDLVIGKGLGQTIIKAPRVDDWLINLTSAELAPIVDSAIRYQISDGDTPADRAIVMGWLAQVQNTGTNFNTLYGVLTATGWSSGNPLWPSTGGLPLYLRLSYKTRQHIIVDVPDFVQSTTADKLDRVINDVLFPDDPTLPDRQRVYLIITESTTVNGMDSFASLLSFSGFLASPQVYTPPQIIPDNITLGSVVYTRAQMQTILKTASADSIYTIYSSAVQQYDPTLQRRIETLALLKQKMSTPPISNLSAVYNWINASGYTSSPRKYNPETSAPETFEAIGFCTVEMDGLQNWLEYLSPDQLQTFIGQTCLDEIGAYGYTRYLTVNTMFVLFMGGALNHYTFYGLDKVPANLRPAYAQNVPESLATFSAVALDGGYLRVPPTISPSAGVNATDWVGWTFTKKGDYSDMLPLQLAQVKDVYAGNVLQTMMIGTSTGMLANSPYFNQGAYDEVEQNKQDSGNNPPQII